jgi:hypothetical protein
MTYTDVAVDPAIGVSIGQKGQVAATFGHANARNHRANACPMGGHGSHEIGVEEKALHDVRPIFFEEAGQASKNDWEMPLCFAF